MSNRNYFVPGKRAHLRALFNCKSNNQYKCFQEKHLLIKQGFNDPTQSNRMRISNLLSGNLRGRSTFGNRGQPIQTNYLGGNEGQPGGSPKHLKNKF
jgi:hypothetical protein